MSTLNRRFRRAAAVRLREPGVRLSLDKLDALVLKETDYEYVKELERENSSVNETLQSFLPKLAELPERYEAHSVAEELRMRIRILESMRPDIEELPRDLLGVVDLIQRLYLDRVFFTEEARDSAKVATFQDVHVAWRILRSMATTLFDLFGTKCDLEREYRDRTGFELALSENSATKEIREAVRQRMVRYCNRYLLAEAHVKYGTRAPKLLRVHFTYRPGSPLIVIGHVGDHLETAGTRRGRGR